MSARKNNSAASGRMARDQLPATPGFEEAAATEEVEGSAVKRSRFFASANTAGDRKTWAERATASIVSKVNASRKASGESKGADTEREGRTNKTASSEERRELDRLLEEVVVARTPTRGEQAQRGRTSTQDEATSESTEEITTPLIRDRARRKKEEEHEFIAVRKGEVDDGSESLGSEDSTRSKDESSGVEETSSGEEIATSNCNSFVSQLGRGWKGRISNDDITEELLQTVESSGDFMHDIARDIRRLIGPIDKGQIVTEAVVQKAIQDLLGMRGAGSRLDWNQVARKRSGHQTWKASDHMKGEDVPMEAIKAWHLQWKTIHRMSGPMEFIYLIVALRLIKELRAIEHLIGRELLIKMQPEQEYERVRRVTGKEIRSSPSRALLHQVDEQWAPCDDREEGRPLVLKHQPNTSAQRHYAEQQLGMVDTLSAQLRQEIQLVVMYEQEKLDSEHMRLMQWVRLLVTRWQKWQEHPKTTSSGGGKVTSRRSTQPFGWTPDISMMNSSASVVTAA